MKFSVLISLYKKESPEFLDQSLLSVFNQTRKADEVVLVEDGPLTSALNCVVEKYQNMYPELIVVRMDKNCGLGLALNEGLRFCHYELVVRMDTDDICKSNRFEKQISFMENHGNVDVCGAWIEEFENSPEIITSIRKVPESHAEIYKYGKRRNPINHPVSVFRKSKIESVGGYIHFLLFEDYYLWARMLVNGARFYNLQEPLLSFRRTPQTFKRRGGLKYLINELKFQFKLFSIGYIDIRLLISNCFVRSFVRVVPNCLRDYIYKKCLR